MADKPSVLTLTGTTIDVDDINTSLATLRDAFENVLGTNGTTGSSNTMTGDLDMNNNTIRNAVIDTSSVTVTAGGVDTLNGLDDDVTLAAGTAITITNSDPVITVTFNPAGLTDNSISGDAIEGGTISNFTSTGIDDNATAEKIDITDTDTTITNAVRIKASAPSLYLDDTNGTADNQLFRFWVDSEDLKLDILNDAESTSTNVIKVLRTGTTVDEVEINATLLDLNGAVDISGNLTVGGTITGSLSIGQTDLNDTTISSPAAGEVLTYNGNVWANATAGTLTTDLNGITDVTLSSPASGEVLSYNGSNWVNSASSSVSAINDLSDVSISGVTSGQSLVYNGTAWANSDVEGLNYFNVKDYGATGDGVTDDLSSINSAITALEADSRGGVLFFPPGQYLLSAKPTITNPLPKAKSFLVKGAGEMISEVSFTAASTGFDITFENAGGWEQTGKAVIGFEDIKISTNQTSSAGSAIKLTSDTTSSVAPIKRLRNVTVAGTSTSAYWDIGLELVDCSFVDIVGFKYEGDVNTGTIANLSGTAIDISGNNNPVDIFIDNLRVYQANKGLYIHGTQEGVYVNSAIMVFVKKGIHWDTTAYEPLLIVSNSHINSLEHGIFGYNLIQGILTNNLLYQINPSETSLTSDWVGIQLDGNGTQASTNMSIVANNLIQGFSGAGAENGIVVSDNGYCTINMNRIHSVDTGVWLKSASTNCDVLDNKVTSYTAFDIYDQGTNNNTRLISSASSFRGALVRLTSDVGIASGSTTTAISWQATDYDTSSIWNNTNPSRLTVPSGVTRVRISSNLKFASNSTGDRQLNIQKNGAGFVGGANDTRPAAGSGLATTVQSTSAVVTVTGGDYFEAKAGQTSGSTLNLVSGNPTWFMMEIIE